MRENKNDGSESLCCADKKDSGLRTAEKLLSNGLRPEINLMSSISRRQPNFSATICFYYRFRVCTRYC